MTANTSSRLAVVAGGACLVNATSRESTFGTGQNTLRGTVPADRAAANQASLTDGVPYTRDPGPAHIRSATSACTITRPRASEGSTASRCSSTGTATLYGRFATSTVGTPDRPSPPLTSAPLTAAPLTSAGGAVRSASVMLIASAVSTVARAASPGARAASVRGSPPPHA